MSETWPGETWPAPGETLVELDIFPPEQHRRWTVLLRALLVIPQAIVLWFLSIAAFFVVVCGWFAALATGRLPDWCGDYLRGYFAYTTRVSAYSMLLVDAYPPFAWNPADYPVRVLFPAPTPLNRVAVLFRLVLAFPILVFASWLMTGWAIIAIVLWLIVLITGRMPRSVFEAVAAVLRTQIRTQAYTYLLTPAYLKGIFGDQRPLPVAMPGAPWIEPVPQSPTRPLLLSQGGQVLLILMLILGIVAGLLENVVGGSSSDDDIDSLAWSALQVTTVIA
ncbi:DUF4389 domain-containing protein [Nocardia sp. NBC_01388]|uniref:DUF4389 domain-containing protein n=1 Tax=Nocardia sp. NBC_01388 TaxID=2903596 RepID=UPI00324A4EE2